MHIMNICFEIINFACTLSIYMQDIAKIESSELVGHHRGVN
jgi:hypothetical protein